MMRVRQDKGNWVYKAYLTKVSSGISKVYLVNWTFRYVYARRVSKVYLTYFSPFVHTRYLLVFRSNL